MADYYTQTVIQPSIPIEDMTPLERLLLENIFEHAEDLEGIYFFASENINTSLIIDRHELDIAICASKPHLSLFLQVIAEQVEDQDAAAQEVELDLSGDWSWEALFQDIIIRSETLEYITAISSFTASKMRPDAFGGIAVLITAEAIRGKSTNDVIDDFMNEANVGDYTPAKPKDTGAINV
jgi:hypothetical protein